MNFEFETMYDVRTFLDSLQANVKDVEILILHSEETDTFYVKLYNRGELNGNK